MLYNGLWLNWNREFMWMDLDVFVFGIGAELIINHSDNWKMWYLSFTQTGRLWELCANDSQASSF